MVLLSKSAQLRPLIFKNFPMVLTASIHHWNMDYELVPNKTKQDSVKPAVYYTLGFYDYIPPYTSNSNSCYIYGDSIRFPIRDPFVPYIDPAYRRKFYDRMQPTHGLRKDKRKKKYNIKYLHWYQWLKFVGATFGFFGMYCLYKKIKSFQPRQYRNGPYYTLVSKSQ